MLFPFLFSCWLLLCFRLCALFRFYLIFGFSLFFHLLLSPLLLFFLFVRLFVGSFTFFLFVGPFFFFSLFISGAAFHRLRAPFLAVLPRNSPRRILWRSLMVFDGLWWSLMVFQWWKDPFHHRQSILHDSGALARQFGERLCEMLRHPSRPELIDSIRSRWRSEYVQSFTWLGLAWLDLAWLDLTSLTSQISWGGGWRHRLFTRVFNCSIHAVSDLLTDYHTIFFLKTRH